jgi:type I restriction enzyme S subunit
MKYKPYPNYKDSGIKWIGEIPEGWKILPIKGICELGRGRVISNEEIGENEGAYPVYSSQTINNGEMGRTNTYNFSGEYVTWTTDGANAGTAFYRNEKFNCTNVCGTLKKRNNRIYMKLLPYILNHITKYYVRYDINPKLMNDMMARIEIFLSPLTEQIVIANFLDKKTAEIDKLIEKDKKLIELLKEKRTVLINHVITKGLPVRRTQTGLDPNVKMKDSGIEWIGEIPEGWEVRRLRFNALVNPSGKKVLSNPKTLVNFLPMEKVSEDGEYENESEIEYQNVSTGYTYFENNDVLVAKITPCFENGKGTLVNNLKVGFGFGTTEFHIIRSYWHLIPRYLFYLTKTHLFRVTGEAFMKGTAGQKRISADFVKDFMMVTPPKIEQLEIVRHLDKATAKIDKTIQKIEQKIELLEEYKKSLIHHTVTGKIDVREVKI